jgi:hypothetical protein
LLEVAWQTNVLKKTKVLAGEEKSVAVQHDFSEQDKIRKARGGDTGADTQAI